MVSDRVRPCELCGDPAGEVLWEDSLCRVVRVGGDEGQHYPDYCRVVWRDHVREMTDLADTERRHLMTLVFATEAALREACRPDKINLASFGNAVPHLHWHVIPRYVDDVHFPAPIWAEPRRPAAPARAAADSAALHRAITAALAEIQGGGLA